IDRVIQLPDRRKAPHPPSPKGRGFHRETKSPDQMIRALYLAKDVDGRIKSGHDVQLIARQLSRKLRSLRLRLGYLSLRSALASIWRIRSRVTENCWPTSSSVWSVFMPMPKRMRSTRSSRGVSEASTRVVVSRRLDWMAASIGSTAFTSWMKSPKFE